MFIAEEISELLLNFTPVAFSFIDNDTDQWVILWSIRRFLNDQEEWLLKEMSCVYRGASIQL
jgi:hypothetical protein